jgi:hypothetical protein
LTPCSAVTTIAGEEWPCGAHVERRRILIGSVRQHPAARRRCPPYPLVSRPLLPRPQDVLADDGWAVQLTGADQCGLTPPFWTHVVPDGEVMLDMSNRLVLGAPAPAM